MFLALNTKIVENVTELDTSRALRVIKERVSCVEEQVIQQHSLVHIVMKVNVGTVVDLEKFLEDVLYVMVQDIILVENVIVKDIIMDAVLVDQK